MRKLVAVLSVALMASFTVALADEKPKHTIKECMKACFKGPLIKKVAGGSASDEDKAKLVEMMEAMAKNTPKKGDEESWKKKTKALVDAAKAIKEGKSGGEAALKKAANCKACHSVHK